MKPDNETLHFSGRVIRVTTDEVLLPNGHRTLLEVVHHPGGAATVALDEEGCVCLLRQYRYVAGGWLWELPAGKLEPDEAPLLTAQRELAEEAGLKAREWLGLGACLSSPGDFTRKRTLSLPTGIDRSRAAPDRAEGTESTRGGPEAPGRWAPVAR